MISLHTQNVLELPVCGLNFVLRSKLGALVLAVTTGTLK